MARGRWKWTQSITPSVMTSKFIPPRLSETTQTQPTVVPSAIAHLRDGVGSVFQQQRHMSASHLHLCSSHYFLYKRPKQRNIPKSITGSASSKKRVSKSRQPYAVCRLLYGRRSLLKVLIIVLCEMPSMTSPKQYTCNSYSYCCSPDKPVLYFAL